MRTEAAANSHDAQASFFRPGRPSGSALHAWLGGRHITAACAGLAQWWVQKLYGTLPESL